VSVQARTEQISSANLRSPAPSPTEDILLEAEAFFRAHRPDDSPAAIANKIENLQIYDVLGMDRVLAILPWGRSGSVLLASYFDGHEDVLTLPEVCGWRLYEFYQRYQSLTLRDKLIAYPFYRTQDTRFFEGNFAISPAEYYAAVQAIIEMFGHWPAAFLESRRAFFLFLHIAYHLALGRRPASSNPLIVYAQHDWDAACANNLVEDFPRAKFIHTVRDPITTCDGAFHFLLDELAERNIQLPYGVLDFLCRNDRPQTGMEDRTRAVRFEDLHGQTAHTMRELAGWVELSDRPSLLDSTFNGLPYVVTRNGVTWTGPRMEQVQRRSRYLSANDRVLLFALLYEDFAGWNYPCPGIFRYAPFRLLVALAFLLAPTKMERVGARQIFERRILPALRRGNVADVMKCFLGIGLVRGKVMSLVSSVVLARCLRRPRILALDVREPMRPDAGAKLKPSMEYGES
jgi:hypothetical protein